MPSHLLLPPTLDQLLLDAGPLGRVAHPSNITTQGRLHVSAKAAATCQSQPLPLQGPAACAPAARDSLAPPLLQPPPLLGAQQVGG